MKLGGSSKNAWILVIVLAALVLVRLVGALMARGGRHGR